MYVSEVFKVASGRVLVIDNIGLMLQGVNTVGLHEKLWVEISSALPAHCEKIQRCVPVAMQYPLCTFSRWKAAPESKQQLG
jgi:uncharacterized membrane protein